MERALHTRLSQGAEDAYDQLHARVPDDLAEALREGGVRDGRDVFHLVDVEDYRAMRDILREHPANLAWQARVTRLQSLPDDYSGEDNGLLPVWSLSAQLADSTREGS